MSKLFNTVSNSTRRIVIRSTDKNKAFNNNTVIAHVYPVNSKITVYIHENARALVANDNRFKTNERYTKRNSDEKCKNEKFAKVAKIEIASAKNPADIKKNVNKAINDLIAKFDERALKIVENNENKANA